ncbi:MAG: sulfotransferase family 2 domain-containing protein [Verrucomicrobia bacterium]|nr:sulfotransferase family 2 domain-containing protein [Verrucomicrobiota bacterium]
MPVIRFQSPECVMVRIPKTGSTSVVKGLFGGMENADETRFGEFPEEWRHLYSFAFVRNPFDRLVSAFVMFQTYAVATDAEKDFQTGLTLDRIMDVIEAPDIAIIGNGFFPKLKLHSIPITHPYFCMRQVKEIFRFEEFDAAYLKLAKTLGLACEQVPHFRKSDRDSFQKYFSDKERQRAEAIYSGDLQEFNYSFCG